MGAFHIREEEGVGAGAGAGLGAGIGVEAGFCEGTVAGIDGGPPCAGDGDGIAVGAGEGSSGEDDGF